MTGPVQVLVVGYEQPAFTGEVLTEMARLSDAGLVRLVDVLLVTRAADGTFDTVDVAANVAEGLRDLPHGNGALAAALLGHSDEPGEDRKDAGSDDLDAPDGPVWSLAESVPAGTTARGAHRAPVGRTLARGHPAHRRRAARRDLAGRGRPAAAGSLVRLTRVLPASPMRGRPS